MQGSPDTHRRLVRRRPHRFGITGFCEHCQWDRNCGCRGGECPAYGFCLVVRAFRKVPAVRPVAQPPGSDAGADVLVGFTFVLLEARDALPAVFALPAGYGGMLIGATATLAAWKLADPSRRSSFILWQYLGITDLVLAVSLGTTAQLINPNGASMRAMTILPLSLIPTFPVPLFVILHVICIGQTRRWPEFSMTKIRMMFEP